MSFRVLVEAKRHANPIKRSTVQELHLANRTPVPTDRTGVSRSKLLRAGWDSNPRPRD